MRLAPCLLVLAGVVHFSASPPAFPTCMKKCDESEARVCKGQSRAWGRVGTSPTPSHLMERCEGLGLTSLVVARPRFIPVAAYWMSLIWGNVHLTLYIHTREDDLREAFPYTWISSNDIFLNLFDIAAPIRKT